MDRMVEAKKKIAADKQPFRDKLREWVHVTYEFYDEYPEAFTFVLLTPHNLEKAVFHNQGKIFIKMIQAARRSGEARETKGPLALSHFTGVLLNVPRLINEGTLRGPALKYEDEVTSVIHRILLAKK